MQTFSLIYPSRTEVTSDFFEIKRIIDARGKPSAMRFDVDGRIYEIDLDDGSFKVGEFKFYPTEETGRMITGARYRPVWFRRWFRTFSQAQGETDSQWILFLGWQITDNGHNVKHTIQIHQDGTVGVN